MALLLPKFFLLTGTSGVVGERIQRKNSWVFKHCVCSPPCPPVTICDATRKCKRKNKNDFMREYCPQTLWSGEKWPYLGTYVVGENWARPQHTFPVHISQPQTCSAVLPLIFPCSPLSSVSSLPRHLLPQNPRLRKATEKGKGQTLDVAIPVVHLGHKVFWCWHWETRGRECPSCLWGHIRNMMARKTAILPCFSGIN